MAAALIVAMTDDLPINEEEEYRRIPMVWRVAIHAAKSTNKAVIAEVLAVSLPHNNQPRDWQAVVVGAGSSMASPLLTNGRFPGWKRYFCQTLTSIAGTKGHCIWR